MGLKSKAGLTDFCGDLSSDKPSPGGGTASAAAGAEAASLLIMVCKITMRNKKYEDRLPKLREALDTALRLRDELLSLAEEDAEAYDSLVNASKRRKIDTGEAAQTAYLKALERASDVPARTAEACSRVLELADTVAGICTVSAYSDVGVAILLAEAGAKGALLNVMINAESSPDERHRAKISALFEAESDKASALASAATLTLQSRRGKR